MFGFNLIQEYIQKSADKVEETKLTNLRNII